MIIAIVMTKNMSAPQREIFDLERRANPRSWDHDLLMCCNLGDKLALLVYYKEGAIDHIGGVHIVSLDV